MMSDLDRRASDGFHPAADDASRPGRSPWFWPVVLALAFVVYELTAQPGLGAAIACTKFGWDDFLTASWVFKRDPVRPRAHAQLWLGFAVGLWKIAVTGIVVMFAAAFLEAALRGPPGPGIPARPPSTMIAACVVAFLGFGTSTIATLRAFRLAWNDRNRLWHDDRLHRDRRADRWPPSAEGTDRHNKAGLVLLTALLVAGIALPAFGFILSYVLLQMGRAKLGWALAGGEAVTAAVWLVLSLGLPIAMLIGRDVIGARVLARSPAECWGAAAEPIPATEESTDHWHDAFHMR
jgi:Tripartite tricarboxylate transporter TctB family